MGEKKLAEAYILGIPFGLFGAHHFYLGRKGFGILYVCTLGLFGLGYIYDLIRMRWLVKHANKQESEAKMVSDVYLIGALGGIFGAHHFYLGNKKLGIFYACTLGVFTLGWIVDMFRMKHLVKNHNAHTEEKSLGTAYILALPPLGIFGAYHYYLGNVRLGLVYTFTFGIFGIGWIVDLFRMPRLVRKAGLNKKSIGTSYIMAMPPFGLFGAHHYYLGNYLLGIVYTCTLGIFVIGWIMDLFRMKSLVKASNDPTIDYGTTKVTAYILCVSPLGIFGAHHFYLKRYLNGGFYVATLGLFGFGWFFDVFRLPVLYERYAAKDKHKYPDEAYLYWFPFGIFGLHHFYLNNKKWGILYACTLGCLGIGWLIDGIRMPMLLKEYNKHIEDSCMNNCRICRPSCGSCSSNSCGCCHPTSEYETSVEIRTPSRGEFELVREMHHYANNESCNENPGEGNLYTELEIHDTCTADLMTSTQPTTQTYDYIEYQGDPEYNEQYLDAEYDEQYVEETEAGNFGFPYQTEADHEIVDYNQEQCQDYTNYAYAADNYTEDDYNFQYEANHPIDDTRHNEDVDLTGQNEQE
ncbi:uncharacterized protein LOC123557541 [Mercenaria mercenaria]|uniref:uncharacterized protein LOC123557541 n=1 Tax=Mercenaria mercenaria TaxID=6596 RepID=UPI00234E8153|nr:uncharacterized protein LOC123557541 [Mercenaria mercenaria]